MQSCQPLSFRNLQVDRYNWVNSNYHNYRIKQSYMRYYDGRKQRHFPCWWWCSRVLDWPMRKKRLMTFIRDHPFSTCRSYDWFFDPSHILPLLVRICTYLEYPLLFCMWSHRFDSLSPVLTFLVCHSFLIFFYFRNSEMYGSP